MCGRYSLALGDPVGLRARFPLGEAVEVRTRYNIAPGDDVLAVTTTHDGQARGELLRWGLIPPWETDPRASGFKRINARRETLDERPAYREAFRRFRCLIPADGFYEWRRVDGSPKQPYRITRFDGAPFAFAGLWSRWRSPDGERTIRTCTIITTAAAGDVRRVHDRMPVILKAAQEAMWLDPAAPEPLLREVLRDGLPASCLRLTAVGPAVSDARYDGPDCVLAAAPAPVQTALF